MPGAGNPQSLNRYSYVLNAPLNYTDHTGHSADCGIGMGCVSPYSPPSPASPPPLSTPPPSNGGCTVVALSGCPTPTPPQLATIQAYATSCPLLACPTSTPGVTIGRQRKGHYTTVERVDWSRVDWLSIGIDVGGFIGDAGLLVALIPNPLAEIGGAGAFGISEIVEGVAFFKDISTLDNTGDPTNLGISQGQKALLDFLKLPPEIGSLASLYDIYANLTAASYTETIWVPDEP